MVVLLILIVGFTLMKFPSPANMILAVVELVFIPVLVTNFRNKQAIASLEKEAKAKEERALNDVQTDAILEYVAILTALGGESAKLAKEVQKYNSITIVGAKPMTTPTQKSLVNAKIIDSAREYITCFEKDSELIPLGFDDDDAQDNIGEFK